MLFNFKRKKSVEMLNSADLRRLQKRCKFQRLYVIKQYLIRYLGSFSIAYIYYLFSNSILFSFILFVLLWVVFTILFDHRDIVLFKPTIRIWFGVPGTGKTSMAAYLSKFMNEQQYHVLSNVPIADTYILEESDLGVYDMSFNDDGAEVIIDEALTTGLYNRLFREFAKSEKPQYFSTHRHQENRIDIFSQGYDVDVNVKDRCGRRGIFHLTNTPLKGFVMYRRVEKILFIKKDDKQFIDGFKYVGLPRLAYARQVWNSFNTKDKSLCPKEQKEWEKWVV